MDTPQLRITDEQLEAMCVTLWSGEGQKWHELHEIEQREFRDCMRVAVATLPFDTLDARERREYEQLKMVAAILGETFGQWKPQTDEGKRMLSLFDNTTGEFMDRDPSADEAVKRLGTVRGYVFNALNTLSALDTERSREVCLVLERIFKIIEGES
jgi:hypothetical protein